MDTCKNCGRKSDGIYCSYCGQKLNPERVSLAYIWHEIFHFFTHLEKGFVFTTIRMLSKPGRTSIEYLEGKRKQYQSPVSYFLIWITIYLLTLFLIEKIFGPNKAIDYKDYFGPGATTRYAISNLSIVLTIVAPFHALYIYLFATRRKFNYVETLVMVIYGLGTIIALQVLFALLSMLVYLFTGQSVPLLYSDIFKIAYIIWMVNSILSMMNKRYRLLKLLMIILLMFGTFTLWRAILLPKLLEYFLFNG